MRYMGIWSCLASTAKGLPSTPVMMLPPRSAVAVCVCPPCIACGRSFAQCMPMVVTRWPMHVCCNGRHKLPCTWMGVSLVMHGVNWAKSSKQGMYNKNRGDVWGSTSPRKDVVHTSIFMEWTRPPMRSRPSRTTTLMPKLRNCRAAAKPATKRLSPRWSPSTHGMAVRYPTHTCETGADDHHRVAGWCDWQVVLNESRVDPKIDVPTKPQKAPCQSKVWLEGSVAFGNGIFGKPLCDVFTPHGEHLVSDLRVCTVMQGARPRRQVCTP